MGGASNYNGNLSHALQDCDDQKTIIGSENLIFDKQIHIILMAAIAILVTTWASSLPFSLSSSTSPLQFLSSPPISSASFSPSLSLSSPSLSVSTTSSLSSSSSLLLSSFNHHCYHNHLHAILIFVTIKVGI